MTYKQMAQWAVTFPVLTLFTVYTLQDHSARAFEHAFAEVASAQSIAPSHAVVVVPNPKSVKNGIIQRVVDRITKKADVEKKLCSLTGSQYEKLLSLHHAVVKTVHIDGQDISVLEPESFLSEGDLAQILKTDPSQIHCAKFEVYQRILMILSAHLS